MIWIDGNKLLIGTCATVRSSLGYYCVRVELALDVSTGSEDGMRYVTYKDTEVKEVFSTLDRDLAEKVRRDIAGWEDYRQYW